MDYTGGPKPLWCVHVCHLTMICKLTFVGPGFWLSVCSDPGIAWISRQVGTDEFAEIAQELKLSWNNHLRLERSGATSKCAEPEPQLAKMFCDGMCCQLCKDGVHGWNS